MPEFDFGHFHILDELGRGGMALVYKAVNTQTDETVALKILYPHLMGDDKNIKRFQREARVASQLRHKYIVPVVDFGEHDNQIYIAMRYMPGNSLAELFAEPRNIKMKGVVRLLGEVASALDYAHDKGVIHRDLKLQNILLDKKRHAHLSDFGIARLVDGTRLTATGQIAGTPMYMSPEQIRGKPVDHRSDIYSFSVMAYLLLTGFYPFTGEDSLSIIHKHVKEFPPTPTEVNAELPESVNAVLLRGLMKLPKDRYETTMDMVKELYKAVNTPELHQTSTRIDIRAVNPVDSVEMDAAPHVADSRIQSPTGQQNELQSDLSSAVVTGPQTLQGVGSRSGIFGIAFAVIIVLAIVIPIVLLIIGNNSGDNNTQALIEGAQTQTRREADFELTQTALAVQLTQEDDDDDDDEESDDNPSNSLPPTWTPTPELTAEISPTTVLPVPESAFPGANAVITASSADMIDGPGRDQQTLTTLTYGTPVEIVGKTGMEDFWEVRTEDGVQGYVSVISVETDIDISNVPNTYFPENPPPRRDNNDGDGRSGNNNDGGNGGNSENGGNGGNGGGG